MKNLIYTRVFSLALLIFSISCGLSGGNPSVTIKVADVNTTFDPKTSLAYIDRKLDRPVLHITLTNFDFVPKNRGDFFRPGISSDPENILIDVEIIADENADDKNLFKTGETVLEKKDDSKQRFYSLEIKRVANETTESLSLINYKDVKIILDSLTNEEVIGSFECQFIAKGIDGKKDENATAKGSFKAKMIKQLD